MPERTLIRQLVEEMKRLNSQPEKPSKTDWWARASVISGFLSSVVIAIVGLLITSSVQRQQLKMEKLKNESDERIQEQQFEAQRERNQSDERLEQYKLSSDLIDHLVSKNALDRAIAISMLGKTAPIEVYQQTVELLAAKDPDPSVSSEAIAYLSRSTDKAVLRAVFEVAHDPSRPAPVRTAASKAVGTLAFTTTLSNNYSSAGGTYLFFATSPGEVAFESQGTNHGLFTEALLRGLGGQAAVGGTITIPRLAEYLRAEVTAQSKGEQIPFVTMSGFGMDTPLFTGRTTLVLIVAIDRYQIPNLIRLSSPLGDAEALRRSLTQRWGVDESHVRLLTAATHGAILDALITMTRDAPNNADIIFYFSGQGFSRNDGKGYFYTYDSTRLGDYQRSLSAEDLGNATSSFKGRKIMFFDMALPDYPEFTR